MSMTAPPLPPAAAPAVSPPPASPQGAAPKPPPAIAANARAFEAVFLGQMTQLMLGSVEQQGELSAGPGTGAFRGMLAEQVGTAIAAHGGIGLAPAVMAQMIRMQGGTGNAR